MEAINNVSKTQQASTIDIMKAQQQIQALTTELQRLRDNSVFVVATNWATNHARKFDINTQKLITSGKAS